PEDTAARRDDGIAARLEGQLALRRGDRERAAEWFAAAAQASADCRDMRDVVESLVGMLASSDDPGARRTTLDWLDQVCRSSGISLLPRERVLVEAVERELADPGPTGGTAAE
ncbi:hypothetical protein ACFQ0D_17920, partial [Micromonospora zhanjiangensis]